MRSSSQILIFIDVQKALDGGIKFYLSDNGVVLTAGNEKGFLPPEFFSRVETADRKPLSGWDGPEGVPLTSAGASPPGMITADGTVSSSSAAGGVDETDEELQSSITANVDEVRGLEEKVKATTL